MKKVTTYYAWDDTPFYYEDECIEYEQATINLLNEIHDKLILSDKQGKTLVWPTSLKIEDLLNWFGTNFNEAEYITVKANLSKEADDLIRAEWGFITPEDVGIWKYNWSTFDWEKVGE